MDIFTLLDEIRIIARNGLLYTQDPFDRERYERLLKLAAQVYSENLEIPVEALRKRFLNELGHITPKVGSEAAIFNSQGEIFLMDRADGSGWCLPCGWVEPGESPAEAAIRETFEETGLVVYSRQLVGVFTRRADAANGPHTQIAVTHCCEITGGELALSPEGLALRYWPINQEKRWHVHPFNLHARSLSAVAGKGELPARSD
jgi:ADP-ribose pyrophosphatase YjhB (NUDIX family)